MIPESSRFTDDSSKIQYMNSEYTPTFVRKNSNHIDVYLNQRTSLIEMGATVSKAIYVNSYIIYILGGNYGNYR